MELRVAVVAAIAFITLYLCAYGTYRACGPAAKYRPKDGGAPVVVVSAESQLRESLYRLFRPCIRAETWYYQVYEAPR